MTEIRIAEAARLLGVSDDTVRRWADSGKLAARTDAGGRRVIDGAELAAFATAQHADAPELPPTTASSARNHFPGLVTRVIKDSVMAQVELQAGPFRIVSLMSAEAVEELGLEVGSVAVASIKSTHVIVGVPA